MAKQSDINLRSKVFYQVFPRQHSKKQNFMGIVEDLDRIKSLGVDVIYLLPIHPIGQLQRKGLKGSPYSIVDYYKIDESLGTLDDLKHLINEIHKRDMKIMMDIVINHTSRDSVLTKKHPEWFYKKADGSFANRIGDWSDITDLDYGIPGVTEYFIDVLKYWAKYFDGYRCDVAPMLPLDFWLKARAEIDKIRPDFIWLTESVEPGFIKYIRDMGYDAFSDSEMYQAFDICYDYDIYKYLNDYLKDGTKLSLWLERIYEQEIIYPKNYIKLRSFENHDQERLASKTKNRNQLIQMNALMYFLRGTAFLYAGQEYLNEHRPNLFEDDIIEFNYDKDLEKFFYRLSQIKKEKLLTYGNFHILNKEDVAILKYEDNNEAIVGIFNLEGKDKVTIDLKDGTYINLLNDQAIVIKNQTIELNNYPVIIKYKRV